jgi:hypothetical protein
VVPLLPHLKLNLLLDKPLRLHLVPLLPQDLLLLPVPQLLVVLLLKPLPRLLPLVVLLLLLLPEPLLPQEHKLIKQLHNKNKN